ncbi:MAG: ester cyclase [Verrucomicrobiota bacterium]
MTDGKRASDANRALLKRLYDEVINGRDLDLIDELLSDDFVEHEDFPGIPPTREGVKQTFAMFYAAFPDIHFQVEDLLAEGDLVAARVTVTGTHQGEFMGIPATGRSVEVAAMDFVSFREGKATAHWGISDMVSLLRQLGVMPPPGG